MTEEKRLAAMIESKDVVLTGPIILDHSDNTQYLAFIQSSEDKNRKRIPSNFLLSNLIAEANLSGISLKFIRVENNENNLDASLKIILLGKKYNSIVRNSFAVLVNNKANIWIEPKINLSENQKESILSEIDKFLDLFEIKKDQISFTNLENIPSSTAILKNLRIIAPCKIGVINARLKEKNFFVPNDIWLNHALDKLRKSGHLVRRKDGCYFLSIATLNSLGTEKSGQSPDIIRMLALPKRQH
jgi:hypothetical protein